MQEKRKIDVAVISDVHLGTYGCHAQELVAYLRSIHPQLLILNGDIIDGWQFSRKYFPPAHIEVVKEVLSMISNGVRVVYVTGNHDEALRRYSKLNIGNMLLVDKFLFKMDGKKIWVFHGDVFDNTTKGSAKILAKLGGKGYDLLILLNRMVNFLSKAIGKEKVPLSKKIKNSVKKAVTYINNFEATIADLAIEKGYDYVICGHIHQPANKEIINQKGKVTYLNSGDWVENLTALECENAKWTIFDYNESVLQARKIVKQKMHIDMVAEDIVYYFQSKQAHLWDVGQ